jgi:hypothetical protein
LLPAPRSGHFRDCWELFACCALPWALRRWAVYPVQHSKAGVSFQRPRLSQVLAASAGEGEEWAVEWGWARAPDGAARRPRFDLLVPDYPADQVLSDSEQQPPNPLVNLVCTGLAVLRSDNRANPATRPSSLASAPATSASSRARAALPCPRARRATTRSRSLWPTDYSWFLP